MTGDASLCAVASSALAHAHGPFLGRVLDRLDLDWVTISRVPISVAGWNKAASGR
jgi:hypothetical protein